MANNREWQEVRRARTRLLIEYGGLVVKAGLAERLEDDRATLLGSFYNLCDQLNGLNGESPETVKLRWRRRGLRAFDEDADAVPEKMGGRKKKKPGSG